MQDEIVVLGAGFSGLTTAAELALRGAKVRVMAQNMGQMPPITIVGTQSRRYPGMAGCTENFIQDDLLERELQTISRFLTLSAHPERTGVRILPALKVSRKPNVWWNVRELDKNLKERSTEIQRNMEMACTPRRVDPAVKEQLKAAGYASVDETPVVMVESEKYLKYLMSVIKQNGGSICLGYRLDSSVKDAIASMKSAGKAVVNCLGVASGSTGGADGSYSNIRGEVLLFDACPVPLPFYLCDDDQQMALTQCPNGQLYLSGDPRPADGCGWDADCTKATLKAAETMCQTLFPSDQQPSLATMSESWALDRPARKEGLNIGIRKDSGFLVVENSGHAGAGVAMSWSCAATVTDLLAAEGKLEEKVSASAAARAMKAA